MTSSQPLAKITPVTISQTPDHGIPEISTLGQYVNKKVWIGFAVLFLLRSTQESIKKTIKGMLIMKSFNIQMKLKITIATMMTIARIPMKIIRIIGDPDELA